MPLRPLQPKQSGATTEEAPGRARHAVGVEAAGVRGAPSAWQRGEPLRGQGPQPQAGVRRVADTHPRL